MTKATEEQKAKRRAYQRAYRERTGNSCTWKYEKGKNGFLMRVYRDMKSRVVGVQWKKQHLYKGRTILPKEEFYAWAKADETFHRLFEAYEAAGFPRKLAPSPDRIDSSVGYTIENMEWVTMSVNSSRSSGNKKKVST